MIEKTRLNCVLFPLLLSVAGQALAQEKARPAYVGPIEAIDSAAAAAIGDQWPDSPQALDVNVASVYKPITPCRLADTRIIDGAFGGGETVGFWGWVGPGGTYIDFGGIDSDCGIPSTATAVHVNFTIVSPKGNGYLRAWPNGVPEPGATLFAWQQGFGAANAATISICSDATTDSGFDTECLDQFDQVVDFWVKIYSDNPEDLVIDAFGYYEPLSLN